MKTIKNIIEVLGYALLGAIYISIILLLFAGAIAIVVGLLAVMSNAGGWLGVILGWVEFILKVITVILAIVIGSMTLYQAGEDFALEFKVGVENSIPGYLGRKYRELKEMF